MRKIIPYIIIFILTIFIYYQFQCRTELISIHESNTKALNDSITRTNDKDGRSVEEKRALALKDNSMKNNPPKSATKGFLKEKVIVQYKYKIKHDTIYIKYKKPFKNTFTIPFSYKKQWLTISGISSNTGLKFNKIYIPNEQTIVVGMKKNGWFKESSPCVRVVNSNPYIVGSNLEGIIIKPKKNFIQKNKFWIGLGAGFVTGFLILK